MYKYEDFSEASKYLATLLLCNRTKSMEEGKVPSLINEVHKRTILWNKGDEEYKNSKRKGVEWDKIANFLRESKSRIQAKWKQLDKKFREEQKKVNSCKSGDGLADAYASNWPYYSSLTFLSPSISPRSTTGNLDILFVDDNSPPNMSNPQGENVDTVKASSSHPTSNDLHKNLAQWIQQSLIPSASVNTSYQANHEKVDKLNLSFFETLLPPLRELSQADTLLCRKAITNIVYQYAYQTKNNSSSETNTIKSVSERKKKRRSYDDDDCQIVSFIPGSSKYHHANVSVKTEMKPDMVHYQKFNDPQNQYWPLARSCQSPQQAWSHNWHSQSQFSGGQPTHALGHLDHQGIQAGSIDKEQIRSAAIAVNALNGQDTRLPEESA